MTFALYWQLLRKQWKIVLGCLLLAGLGSFLVSEWITPVYLSTALIQVTVSTGNGQADYDSLLASNQLAQTEAQLAISNGVLREVASHYQGLDIGQLAKQVSASPRVNTQLFSIDVRNSDRALAASLANDIAATFLKQQKLFAQQHAKHSKDFMFIVQPAQPASSPVQPDIRLNTLAGIIMGLLLGLLLAVLYDQLDMRIYTPEALTQLLEQPILGTIWRTIPGKDGVINPAGHSPNLEAYRILRTNIGFASAEKPMHTLAIVSAIPHEGKSVIAANLAIFMARSGKNTLLIDADMRCPSIYEKFGLPVNKMGLSNAIMAYAHQLLVPASSSRVGRLPAISLEPFMHNVGIPNLRVMPSGPLPPNPPELLDSKGMECLFAALMRCGAEVVVFDTPPLLGISDAAILAPKVDGTLFVVEMNRASRSSLLQAKTILAQAGAHISGCIVNKCTYKRKKNVYADYYRRMAQSHEELAGANGLYTTASTLNGFSRADSKTGY
ncbi:MAG TPA: polysaccharide biosynthesis tyrosine autokinase [Ktedonobacteraceae bacterium]|jgi:capsular exopolysaccharide synthesis family protein